MMNIFIRNILFRQNIIKKKTSYNSNDYLCKNKRLHPAKHKNLFALHAQISMQNRPNNRWRKRKSFSS